MDSKAALNELYAISNCTKCEHYSECNDGYGTICDINKKIILYDLERLEHIDKDFQLLMDKSIEISNKLTKYEKVIKILKEYRLKVMFNQTTDKSPYILFNPECDGCVVINQEEYELLKEVLDYE